MPLPKNPHDWAKELHLVWQEAQSIFAENRGTPEQLRMIYRMAPTLALYQRGLEASSSHEQIIDQALASIAYIHKKAPATADDIIHSFNLTYLQTHVHAGLLSAAQASELLSYLQQQQASIAERPAAERLH